MATPPGGPADSRARGVVSPNRFGRPRRARTASVHPGSAQGLLRSYPEPLPTLPARRTGPTAILLGASARLAAAIRLDLLSAAAPLAANHRLRLGIDRAFVHV